MTSLAHQLPLRPRVESATEQPLVRPRRIHKPITDYRRDRISVAPTAIIGFVLVCIMVVAMLVLRIRLDQINDQKSTLSAQLTALEKNYQDLSSQYDQVFDLEGIKTSLTENGAMIQLTTEQTTYMDLSQPDSAEVYEEPATSSLLPLSTMFAQVVDYFR